MQVSITRLAFGLKYKMLNGWVVQKTTIGLAYIVKPIYRPSLLSSAAQ